MAVCEDVMLSLILDSKTGKILAVNLLKLR